MPEELRGTKRGDAIRLECGCICVVEARTNNDQVLVQERRLCSEHRRPSAMFVRLRPGRELVEKFDVLAAALEDRFGDEP